MIDDISLNLIICVVISYFLGNISPSTIMGKIYGVDIRHAGSGNPGTTNTLREIGPAAAGVTLLVDIMKGVAAVLIGQYFSGSGLGGYICGTAVFLGHIWPVCYKFKGGKGIATGFGVMLVLDWRIGLLLLVIAAAGALISQRMSVGSIAAAVALPILFGVLHGSQFVIWAVLIGLIIIWRHRSNIVRMIHHEEPPIGIFEKIREHMKK